LERTPSVRIASHNVNGIRAALRRGYPAWVQARQPDVICLQEVRAPDDQVPAEAIDGYHFAYHAGDRAGRNGVAVASRTEPSEVWIGFGSAEFDPQGRYVEVDLPRVTVASLYLPKGDVYGPKFEAKMRFMAEFSEYIVAAAARSAAAGREFVVCGDYNIAHTENDIKSWKTNLKSDGFLPEERAWYGAQIDPQTGAVVDVLRRLYPDQPGPYSWWSWRGKAFDNDAGWRIDHHWATPGLAAAAHAGAVDRAPSWAERISDHAPVTIDYDLDIQAGS
jgi:exodeoxyribonuclease-3